MGTQEDRPFRLTWTRLRGDAPAAWDELIHAVRPAAMLLLIEARMGAALRTRLPADDVWQETLLRAWGNRARFDGRDLGAFRHWLLAIAEDRLHSLLENEHDPALATVRPALPLRAALAAGRSSPGPQYAGPVPATSPLRAASDRAEARAMRAALDGLPPEQRYLLWLREFEGLEVEEIAERLELDGGLVRERVRRGLISYQHRVRAALRFGEQEAPQ
ncbi:MAG: sigma-70 family RNA polymerase sigma factor [Planctomycetes bacterium]|nr:sigma-70 family RNA polymerase sigma factor [Planctomycetota bacterium]